MAINDVQVLNRNSLSAGQNRGMILFFQHTPIQFIAYSILITFNLGLKTISVLLFCCRPSGVSLVAIG